MNITREIIHSLSKKEAYPHSVREITTITTAVSVLFLTGEYVYKINKPVNLGFLDFSTLEKRKEQCENEVKYNSLISPELYLGVVPIFKQEDGNISLGKGKTTIEYAVKMRQVDPHATMDALLQQRKITPLHIQEIASILVDFHDRVPTNEEISSYGSRKSISYNWEENFTQTKKYIPKLLSSEDFTLIQDKVRIFLERNAQLFDERVARGKIKHCHGDLHSGNIFVAQKKIYIFDGIVFNKRFPCADVIAEIAFLAMDLDFYGRKDLSDLFIQHYRKLSADKDILRLLDFYKCYRAYIRAKINCFTLDDQNISQKELTQTEEKAKKYFQLAKEYALLL